MALVVMIPFDTVLRIIDRAENNVPPHLEIGDILPKLTKQKILVISGHCQIALELRVGRADPLVLLGSAEPRHCHQVPGRGQSWR